MMKDSDYFQNISLSILEAMVLKNWLETAKFLWSWHSKHYSKEKWEIKFGFLWKMLNPWSANIMPDSQCILILFQVNSWFILALKLQQSISPKVMLSTLVLLIYVFLNLGSVFKSFVLIGVCLAISWVFTHS